VDNFYIIDMLWRLLQLWEDEFIFVRSFTDLLKSYLKPQLEMAKQKLQPHELGQFDQMSYPMMGSGHPDQF